jgi:hypothetical protein
MTHSKSRQVIRANPKAFAAIKQAAGRGFSPLLQLIFLIPYLFA